MILDARLGNAPRWFLTPPSDYAMRVPDYVLKCVVFLGIRQRSESHEWVEWGGTGFLVALPFQKRIGRFIYLVTAKHLADQLEGREVLFRINTKDGKARIVEGGSAFRWWRHPDQRQIRSVDVAVTPFSLPDDADCTSFPTVMFVTDEMVSSNQIGPGDEVFVTGLFSKMEGYAKSFPLVRVGNVAMLPDELVPNVEISGSCVDAEVYLVEVRSLGGLSGSPVFVREPIGYKFPKLLTETGFPMQVQGIGSFWFLGLMHGHWKIKAERINKVRIITTKLDDEAIALGISVVVPAKKVLEVLNHPDLVKTRQEEEARLEHGEGTTTQDHH